MSPLLLMPMLGPASQAVVTQSRTWLGYGGSARVVLAVVLLVTAAATLGVASRVPLPARPPKLGRAAEIVVTVAWVLALVAFVVCLSILIDQARRDHLPQSAPADPITPITLSLCGAIFLAIVFVSRSYDWKERVKSAVVGAIAAPMIFELPFDLIVMTKSYPPIAPDPALYRVILFVPLFLVEILTLSFLLFSPMVRLKRSTLSFFVAMLVVFAIWGIFGFTYPSSSLPFSLNVLAKVLAFATALSLFVPLAAALPASPGGEVQQTIDSGHA